MRDHKGNNEIGMIRDDACMKGLEKIKERILEDARREADGILENANKRADDIINKAGEKADAIKKTIGSEYEEKAAELERRILSTADLDMKKKLLDTKQRMIDKAFEGCIKHIEEMPTKDYRALIGDLLISAVQTGEEEVIFSALDDNRLDSYVITEANEKLKSMGRKGSLKLSQEKGGFKGGFILRQKGMEINCSFEALLRTLREQIEPRIAEILFQ